MRPVAAVCLALFALLAPARALALDLTGTWYVLVHYTDDTAHDPKQPRWDERLWTFAPKGAQLEWTERTIVVFADESGRFERLGSNRASRVVGAWEPNPGQLAQIEGGLEYNTRGEKKKLLRGSASAGWTSGGGSGASAAGANVLSYVETWSIDDPSGLPVFTRDDSLGGGSHESLEGRTQYTAKSVDENGVIQGSFERDGTRHGTFRMYPSGQAGVTKGSGLTQEERMRKNAMQNLGSQLLEPAELEALQQLTAAGGDPAQVRSQVEKRVREMVVREATKQGIDPGHAYEPIDRAVEQITDMLMSGKDPSAIKESLERSGTR